MVVVGGVTRSTDFPTSAAGGSRALQGPSDGFLLNLSNDGRGFFPPIGLLLGGSRDDRVLSLSLNGGMLAVVGDTNSPDLNWGPAGKAQSSLAGGKDAFFAFGPAFRVQALPF